MPRHTVLSIVALALAAPAHAQPPDCGWVDGIPSWEASISWSWSNQHSWTNENGAEEDAQTQDAGSATASLVPLYAGGNPGGLPSWNVSFFDRLDVAPIGSPPQFEQTVLSGSHPDADNGVALYLDKPTCTYRWRWVPYAPGTSSSIFGSMAIVGSPSRIVSGERAIPSDPGPLEFDGILAATTHVPLNDATPVFLSNALSAGEVENGGIAPLPNASVHWSFVPAASIAPGNDACVDAFSLGGSHNIAYATSAPTDPVSACGSGDRSVWFTIMPSSSGTVEISTSRSNFWTVVSAWPLAQTCAALTTEIACGERGASVPVEEGVPLLVQIVRSSADGRDPTTLVVDWAPEPSAVAASGVACMALAYRARTRRRGRSAVTRRHSASL